MPRSARSLALFVGATAPLIMLLVALGGRELDPAQVSVPLALTAAAMPATLIAVLLVVAGRRGADARTVVCGAAFFVMGALLTMHVAGAPGVLSTDSTPLTAVAGGLAIPVGAAMLAAAGDPVLRGGRLLGPATGAAAVVVALVMGIGVVGFLSPHTLPERPAPLSLDGLVLLVVGGVCLATLALRATTTLQLTQRRRDLAVVVGLALLVTALVAAFAFGWQTSGFWWGHTLQVGGILLIGGAMALDLRDAVPSQAVHGDLSATALVLAEEAFLGTQVRALMHRLAEKDAYTEGHTRRVAILATQVGEHMRLSHRQLRELALAGLLHDVGKLEVPDAILNKPARLTDEEFVVIRRHPVWGEELLEALGGFPAAVRAMVRGHHERLDGNGYPDGLTARALSAGTRILGACDVYDALVTERVYRPAWAHADALALLERESGTAFDPDVVAALRVVLGHGGAADVDAEWQYVVALAEAAAARALDVPPATSDLPGAGGEVDPGIYPGVAAGRPYRPPRRM